MKMVHSVNKLFEEISKAKKEFQERFGKEFQISYAKAMKDVREAMDINMFYYNWAITENMAPREYTHPYLEGFTQEQTDEYFINIFSEEERLGTEFNDIKKLVGPSWHETLDETYELILDDKFRVAIPLLVTGIEKGIKNVMDEFSDHTNIYGGALKNKVDAYLTEYQNRYEEHPYLEQFARIISHIYREDFFENIYTREQISSLNRNLISHGNDKPDEWTKRDLYQLIAFFSSTAMLLNR
ncbi:hypothetical protein [Marinococcus luteus]|uniref:hypothetical protein n=1 Tax=Marinococcus luteus TaxID=1122204 RepID=UPI002ACD1234|nr:hypothetical protein [Marinococcus luteus]MDZ5782092.1 hypothetical protein [Marinococcus luteus]